MKIEVITLHNVRNYGSVLQTYATQKILESFGYEVEFIDYVRKNDMTKKTFKDYVQSCNIKKFFKSVYQYYYYIPKQNRRAELVFGKFLKENIHLTKQRYYSVEELKNNVPKADIYCTGSDQMWNSKWNQGIEKAFFLDFVDTAPKIAFSTSIGMTEFPEKEVDEIIRLINKYSFLAMREESAVQLLSRYGIKSTAVLDPTLMCDGDFWREFCSEESKKYCNEKYILVYKLHQEHYNNVDFNQYVHWLSERMGLPVKVLSYGVPIRKSFSEYIFMPTIKEFVALFANAQYVVTDSFHATSFSINLGKQLSVIYPQKFSTRLENILKICNMLDRVIDTNEYTNVLYPVDYNLVNEIMNVTRKQSLQSIKNGIIDVLDTL